MTEEEAKTKWCPFTRVLDGDPGDQIRPASATATNRGGPAGNEQYTRCLGSGCMAWRWDTDANVLADNFPKARGDTLRAMMEGHCGLAGEP